MAGDNEDRGPGRDIVESTPIVDEGGPAEAERRIGASRGQGNGEAPPEQQQDPLDHMIAAPGTNAVTRMIAFRLREVEKHFPEAFQVGQSLVNANARLNQIEAVVNHLSQQRAIAEVQMERQVRATAIDMAIKALPETHRTDPDTIVTLAEGFLMWLKGGVS